MLVAQLIIGAFFACLVIWGFIAFNAHTKNKFGYSFFTKFSFLVIGASLLLIGIGNKWQISSLEENGDVLNGTLIMAISIAIFVFLCI